MKLDWIKILQAGAGVVIGLVVYKLVMKITGMADATETMLGAQGSGFFGVQKANTYACHCKDGSTVYNCSRPDKCDECCRLAPLMND